ncbi:MULTISPECIES: phosphatidate cytidylyltransferase [unclassified Halanaerobium]|uniref:phosphatidate cytidylyltransferase n=1 Tax=unclassified Halanaerobium TaxID=2641197 RepID=UPI000DF28214|nr:MULTISPECIES: phosphatidate cytidylyltransferase [unclassified Halanaerobium]
MLKKRVVSAVIGILLLILLIFYGSLIFTITVSVLVFIGLKEYCKMIPFNIKSSRIVMYFSGFLLVINSYFAVNNFFNLPYGIILFVIAILLYLDLLFNYDDKSFLKNLSCEFFGIIYIAGGMSFAVFLRDFPFAPFQNTFALWFVLIATWITDSSAYFIGKNFGKKQLAPKISPNKTLAGGIGGVLFTAIFILLVGYFLNINSFYWVIYSFLMPAAAIIGDLFESCLKRNLGVKDTGNIIPGHGGILDRFDSFIFTAPATYYFLYFLLVV